MRDVMEVLVRPATSRSHHLVVVEIRWGNLPECVRREIKYMQILQYVVKLWSCASGTPPEFFTVDMQSLMESAVECSEANRDGSSND